MTYLLFSPLKTFNHHARLVRTITRSFVFATSLIVLMTGCTLPTLGAKPELKGHISVIGSTALEPLVSSAASLFEQQRPQIQVDVQGSDSTDGLNRVTNQQADIGTSDIYADVALYSDPNLTDHIVAIAPFTMIVGPGVTVTSLTSQQLIDIFSTGRIRNWKEVGGKNMPIIPVIRPSTSGTRAAFRKYVLGGLDETSNSTGTLVQKASSVDVLKAVAQTVGAIGYLALSVLDSSVHALAINGKVASLQNIQNGSYSFWSYEHMYTLGEKNALVTSFLDFMFSPSIQSLSKNMHYIPASDIKLSKLHLSLPGVTVDAAIKSEGSLP